MSTGKPIKGTRSGKENLTKDDRRKIERYDRAGLNASQIARELGRHPSTIQKELIRGRCEQITDPIRHKAELVYDWYYAQMMADNAAMSKGRPRKIEPGSELLARAEELVMISGAKKYSPYAALETAKQEGKLPVSICTTTFYTYIHTSEYNAKGIHLKRPNAECWKEEEVREAKNRPPELSIDNRPKKVVKRKEFGHWEGDLVCSPTKCGGSAAAFTLLERKTRKYIVIKIPSKSPKHVKKALDIVESRFGDLFSQVVKTITFDNGLEFVNYRLLQQSTLPARASPRFDIYYAHPYRSGERGSNENANGLLRRFFPKGTNFAEVSMQDVFDAADWLNNYPRKLLSGKSSTVLFDREIEKCKRKIEKRAKVA